MPRTIAIIQARMSSSRLPGKVLLDIGGKPMLQHVIERTQRARSLDAVVVATTTDDADRPVADFCTSARVPCFRGSPQDVLDRYYQVAKAQAAEIAVRITGDCPLIDPALIDRTVQLVNEPGSLDASSVDFACNRLPPPFTRTFPIGLDVEVCTFAALERAWREAGQPFQREHVMPFLYEGVTLQPAEMPTEEGFALVTGVSPRGFRIAQLHHDPDYGGLRWTVDTAEDLTLVGEIFARLGEPDDFSWRDILRLWAKDRDLAQINAGVRHKTLHEVDERTGK
jgi:spore coat polysaccharide biosynthesis protein SpsF